MAPIEIGELVQIMSLVDVGYVGHPPLTIEWALDVSRPESLVVEKLGLQPRLLTSKIHIIKWKSYAQSTANRLISRSHTV